MTTFKNKTASKLLSLIMMLAILMSFASVMSVSAEESSDASSGSDEVLTYGYFEYRVVKNGKEDGIYITKYIGDGGDVSVPATINNIPVDTVGIEAFWYRDDVTAVNLPDGLMCIEAKAFQGCENLEYVVIPDTVIEIGDAAFEGCKKLADINLPANLLYVGGSAFDRTSWISRYDGNFAVIFDSKHLYKYNGTDTIVNIPEGVISISSNAFAGNQSIEYVHIPETVQFFGSFSFYNCPALKSLSVPDNALYIGSYAFGIEGFDEEQKPVLSDGFVLYANEETEGAAYCSQWGVERRDRKYNATPDELPSELISDITITAVEKDPEIQNLNILIIIVASVTAVVIGLYVYFTVKENKRQKEEKEKKKSKKNQKKKSKK